MATMTPERPGALARLVGLWHSLTQPPASILEEERRRQARVLSSFLLLILCASLAGLVFVCAGGHESQPDLFAIGTLSAVAYLFSRTRHLTATSAIFIGGTAAVIFAGALSMAKHDPQRVNDYLIWLAIPILVSGLVFSVRITILASGIILAAVWLVISPLPAMPFEPKGLIIGFVATIVSLTVIVAQLYYQNLSALRQQLLERQKTEEHLEAMLEEKELLLREIHHRVKNNLQVVASLLSLQAGHLEEETTRQLFGESQHRIRSMALIHEQLYQSEDLARIDLAEYVRALTAHLFHAYNAHAQGIKLHIEADPITLDIDTAIPCGLILNELVSNVLKHAFPDGGEGEIEVELHANGNGQYAMIVHDNGVGLPASLDFRNTSSLGLQLVNSLARQLGGTVDLRREGGTAFEIRFSAPGSEAKGLRQ